MVRRLAAPGLAGLAALLAAAGASGLARLVLLAAIVAAAVRLLDAVGLAAEDRADRTPVALCAAALALVVAAAAAHVPLLVLAALACFGVEKLTDLLGAVAEAPAAELEEAPLSRAA